MDVSERLAHQGIYVPPSTKKPKWRCNVPGCDALFYEHENEKRIRHAAEHARKDADDIRAEGQRRQQRETFGEGDPEKESWLKRRYRQLVGKVPDPTDPRHY